MACSLGCGTEPKFLIINSFEGLLRTIIKSKNLHFHERANFGSAPSRPCSKVTHNILLSRNIGKFVFCVSESVSVGIVVFVGVEWMSKKVN